MAMRGVTLLPSMVTRSLICINEISDYDIAGVFYNPYTNGPAEFGSWYGMICIMEEFFDCVSFPHPHCQYRSFTPKRKQVKRRKKESEVRQYMSEEIFTTESGEKGTFVVHVQFRQNATWQGTITWTEGKKIQHFRSVMEMLKLMESALDSGGVDESAL